MRQKLTTLLGANTTNSILSAFLLLTGVSNQEKKILARNIELKDIYKDQRCFILGNGPSIKNMDLSELADEKVFTVNQFTKSKVYKDIKPTFHLWSDERFFDLNEKDKGDMEILSDMKEARISASKPIVFYKISAKILHLMINIKTKLIYVKVFHGFQQLYNMLYFLQYTWDSQKYIF